MKMFGLQVNYAILNHRGELELHGIKNGMHVIQRVKGDIQQIIKELENRVPIVFEPLIFI